jgi:hypothetical protein
MKKLILLTLGIIITFNPMFAQEYIPSKDIYPFGFGMFVAGKAAVNTQDSPNGIKNGMSINGMPDIGLQVYVPFGGETNIGATLDFAYLAYSYKFRITGQESTNYWTDKLSYFSISPNFHLSGFLLGFNFGFPLSAEGNSQNPYYLNYNSINMNTYIDVHFGGLIPVYKDNFGRVNLYIQGEYALSEVFVNKVNFSSTYSSFNIQPAALKIGISYIFNTKLLRKKI